MANSTVLGLDIGSSQIKAAQVERRRNQWSLVNAGIVPTPPDSVQDGIILDLPRVTEAVRQLLRENRMSAGDTVAAVSGSHVIVRPIKVPDMNLATLKRSIRFEAAKHVDPSTSGVSIENAAVEFEVLGRSGQPPQLDVLLVVAPNPMVNGRVSVMEGAGLEPVAVDVEAFALLRMIEASGLLPPPGQAVVVMSMGATYTDLNIIVGNEVRVTRSIPIGGNALTHSVASALNVPIEEAEAAKRRLELQPDAGGDLPDSGLASGYSSGPDLSRQVALPFVDELIRELRRSVIYFQSQEAEAGNSVGVEQLVLAGGGTQLPRLGEYLRERLGIAVTVLDPIAAQSGPAALRWKDRGTELAVAVGLALKEYN